MAFPSSKFALEDIRMRLLQVCCAHKHTPPDTPRLHTERSFEWCGSSGVNFELLLTFRSHVRRGQL